MLDLLSIFKRQPTHTVPRFHAATKEENARARQRRADVRMELEMMALHMTDEQRARARSNAMRKRG